MAGNEAARIVPNTPLPNPPPHSSPDGERSLAYGGREQSAQAFAAEPDLTAKARGLYEKSAVPVREIARLCGVTERTVYKYAAKGHWKPRYRWTPEGTRPAADPATNFAPAKGAGGRFIRREDVGQPFAKGLKATDPSGRAKALAACGTASRLSRRAQRQAEKEERDEAFLRALAFNARCLADLRRHRESHVKGRAPSALHLRIEGALLGAVEWSAGRLETFLPPLKQAVAPGAAALPEPRFGPDDFRAWLPPAAR